MMLITKTEKANLSLLSGVGWLLLSYIFGKEIIPI